MQVQSLGGEDLLEEGVGTHSSILAWRISWTEEPGWLQSMGHSELTHTHTHTHTRSSRALLYISLAFSLDGSFGERSIFLSDKNQADSPPLWAAVNLSSATSMKWQALCFTLHPSARHKLVECLGQKDVQGHFVKYLSIFFSFFAEMLFFLLRPPQIYLNMYVCVCACSDRWISVCLLDKQPCVCTDTYHVRVCMCVCCHGARVPRCCVSRAKGGLE